MASNPYANMTIGTSTVDSDGENITFTFVFGHACPPDEFEARLKEAVQAWLRTEDAEIYVESVGSAGFDWIEALGQIPEEALTTMEIARLDTEANFIILDPDEDLVPEDLAERFMDISIHGREEQPQDS